jgi:capsid protein
MEFGLTRGKPLDWKRVPARDPDTGQLLAFLLFERSRVDLIRGVPWLAPVVETVKQLGNYTTAEAQAAVVGAYFTVFVTSPAVVNAEDQTMVGSNDSRDVDDPAKEARLEDPGAIIELNSGQEVSTAAPGRPNTAFDGFVSSLCQHIGVALELPYELVIKRFQASYSASRAALETAWQFFRKQRSLFAWRFCQTAYEWMMEEAVASGRIVADGFFDDAVMREAWLGADWIGPSRINLDPKKESDADKQDVELGVKTRQQVITERTGGTFEQKTRQLVKEEAARKELAPPEPKPGAAKHRPPPEAITQIYRSRHDASADQGWRADPLRAGRLPELFRRRLRVAGCDRGARRDGRRYRRADQLRRRRRHGWRRDLQRAEGARQQGQRLRRRRGAVGSLDHRHGRRRDRDAPRLADDDPRIERPDRRQCR